MLDRYAHVGAPASAVAGQPLAGSPVARLRPRTAPQVLDAGFEVLRFRAKVIAILLVVLHGPFYAASVILVRQADDVSWPALLISRLWSGTTRDVGTTADYAWIGGSWASALFGEMLFAVALASLIRAWLEGRDPGAPELLRATLRRLPAIAAVWVIALIMKSFAAALCGVGILLVVPYLSILAPVVAFEPGGPFTWLGRSRHLVGRAAGKALFLTLMAPALSLLVSWGLSAGQQLGIASVDEVTTVMGIAASLLLVVARCSAMALFYIDIRVRTEGLDLAIRAPDALGGAT